MLTNRALSVCLLAAATGAAFAQTRPAYLEISKAQIKSDRVKDWEDGVHRLMDVNRRLKGDTWITLSTEYGDSGSFLISTSRENMAVVESGMEAFLRSLKEGMGPAGDRLLRDLGGMSNSFRSEIRRRRWDLSAHPPEDAEGLTKLVAGSRWIRTVRLELKSGKGPEFVEAWKKFRDELAQMNPPITALVSESVTGIPTFHVGLYYKSMAQMDAELPSVQKAFATPAYASLMKVSGDTIASMNWEIHRMRPDLSNPPEAIVNADPAFWKPPVMTSSTKKGSGSADRR